MKGIIALAAVSVFIFSCSPDPAAERNGNITGADSAIVADSAHLFILPTPLQLATFLYANKQAEHAEYLSDQSISVDLYSTDYERAMNLGVCIADVGYAALFGNQQLALDYLSRCEALVKKLRIEPAAAPYLARIRNNIRNRDSLSYLLLSMYEDVQNNLNASKREKTAFFIVSGCYIENLAIMLQYEQETFRSGYKQLLAQEKLWLDNIAEACTYLDPDSATQDLYSTFYTLQEFSDEIKVETKSDNTLTCSFTAEAFTRFRDKCLQLRNAIPAHAVA